MTRASIPLRHLARTGYGGIVVAAHHLAAAAGAHLLTAGGNAVDAAIAVNAVQGVVAPETCGIGGDLFCLLAGPGHQPPMALNASGRAGAGADDLADELRRAGVETIPQRHPAAVTVPGCVDGWLALHSGHGRLDLGTALAPAIRLAADGFPVSTELADAFTARLDDLAGEEGAQAMYPDGRPPMVGARIRRPLLARTLEAIAAGDRDVFYSGEIGRSIISAVGGAINEDDLASPQADWVTPLSIDVYGSTGWTVPPNSQGYIALRSIAVLERIGLTDPADPVSWHLAIEAYRAAAADRDDILADPDTMTVETEDLVSSAVIEELAASISPDSPTRREPVRPASGGTAFMCVVDGDGLGVSLIQSNFHGIGSGRSVPAGGFVLQDRGRGFNLAPGHPNSLGAGRRPLHTLSPTIWTRDRALTAIVGTRGGHIQPLLVSQLATSIVGRGLDPAAAMTIPRWATEGGQVELEPGTPPEVVTGLRDRGHEVRQLEAPQGGWGPMSAITIGGDGLQTGAADPRVDTTAAVAV